MIVQITENNPENACFFLNPCESVRILNLLKELYWSLNYRSGTIMGKGDKRSKKGKIFAKSFGKTRPRKYRTAAKKAAAK